MHLYQNVIFACEVIIEQASTIVNAFTALKEHFSAHFPTIQNCRLPDIDFCGR